jgi:hypothetical protein
VTICGLMSLLTNTTNPFHRYMVLCKWEWTSNLQWSSSRCKWCNAWLRCGQMLIKIENTCMYWIVLKLELCRTLRLVIIRARSSRNLNITMTRNYVICSTITTMYMWRLCSEKSLYLITTCHRVISQWLEISRIDSHWVKSQFRTYNYVWIVIWTMKIQWTKITIMRYCCWWRCVMD